jgi:hypothetical protein
LKTNVLGIHLDGIGFPRSEYCTCQRCSEGRKINKLEWEQYRSKVVNDFVMQASRLVKEREKSFSVTLMPDPCFGTERYGQDPSSLSKYVDFFVVPIYDLAYSTTYWLETLAYGFYNQLKKPLYIELYATTQGPKLKNLLAAIVAVSEYADGIILATHDTCLSKRIQEELVHNTEFTNILERHYCKPMIDVIKKWKTIL